MTREVAGTIDGDSVRIRSAFGEQHGDSINLTFTGKVDRGSDERRAGHGRIPRCDLDGDAPQQRGGDDEALRRDGRLRGRRC